MKIPDLDWRLQSEAPKRFWNWARCGQHLTVRGVARLPTIIRAGDHVMHDVSVPGIQVQGVTRRQGITVTCAWVAVISKSDFVITCPRQASLTKNLINIICVCMLVQLVTGGCSLWLPGRLSFLGTLEIHFAEQLAKPVADKGIPREHALFSRECSRGNVARHKYITKRQSLSALPDYTQRFGIVYELLKAGHQIRLWLLSSSRCFDFRTHYSNEGWISVTNSRRRPVSSTQVEAPRIVIQIDIVGW